MEILPRTDLDFDKFADIVSSEFLSDGVPLNEGIKKIAMTRRLNPEQIKRLAEKTNTITTVKFLKSASDKKAEFALADSSVILKETHFSEEPFAELDKAAAAEDKDSFRFPEGRSSKKYNQVFAKFATTLTKQAETAPAKKPFSVAEIFNLEKKASEYLAKKVAYEVKVQDNIDYIVSEFSRWKAPDFSKFASEAVTLYGDKVSGILDKLAAYLEVSVDMEKVAYTIDDSQPLLVKLAEVLESLTGIISSDTELRSAQEQLKAAWQKAKGK